jgi:sugar O-acyltransferase (sialic acid O-acetyltransferase NeuD family)
MSEMSKVVLFGLRDFASLAHYYLKYDSPHEVVAFTVDREFVPAKPTFEGCPVVAFDDIENCYPPDEFSAFAPLSHQGMNRLRRDVYERFKQKGYRLISYVSSRATCFPGTPIGDNCFILEDNTIQPFVRIGNNVVLWSGNHIGHHSTIGDHVFFTSHVVLSGHCLVDESCFFGVNATIRDGLRISQGSLIGMGAVVGRDTEPWSVHKGNSSKPSEFSSLDVDFTRPVRAAG